MTTTKSVPLYLVGLGVDRVDGRLKVMGAAHYPSDFNLPEMAYAALVRSTIAAGTITHLDTDGAVAMPGVLAVITHQNAGRLQKAKRNLVFPPPAPPLQDAKIRYHGQYIAMVVAETRQQAAAAARLIEITYDRHEPVLDPEDAAAKPKSNPYFIDMKRGDVKAAMTAAEVTVEGTFTTSAQTHNPLGLFTTTAHWADGALTVYDSTQNPFHVRAVLAASFGIAEDKVRVLSPFVGGGFGAGLRSWPLTAGTTAVYACPNVAARDKRVRLNIPPIAHMRAPGEAEGNFAIESLLDELSYELGMDPIELRLRNYAEAHPQTGLPWSSKALRECYEVGGRCQFATSDVWIATALIVALRGGAAVWCRALLRAGSPTSCRPVVRRWPSPLGVMT